MATTATTAAAESVGAADVFVLRRVSGQRFVHFGGLGRGEGWAGIVEVSIGDEVPLSEALRTGRPVKLDHGGRELVFGPYYARAAAVVPVLPDIVVVFGASEHAITADEETLQAAANTVAGEIEPAGPAKQLADELEVLEAVRAALSVPQSTVEDAMVALAAVAAEALSCELGIVYLADGDRVGVAERGWRRPAPDGELAAALRTTFDAQEFPQCVQDARSAPPPGALAGDPGIRSYYLLALTGAANGVLFVAHTDAAPRGFTLLCRRLGLRVAEIASAILGVAVTREWTAAESARLQSAFSALEG
ncbi:MAG: hypothetical protein JO186_09325 [Actinobacteria bacterium]|nr:hypothetical protein [Actinomycetota bacterium]MBV8396974.1 hypothetical protein [Actinomycetota bacterium]MBV8597306.1 hypothetical protein [Actinomycetota bacterium]